MPTDAHRLPTTITPVHYRLRLEPDIATNSFAGVVQIDATADQPSGQILLNAEDLSISEASVVQGDQRYSCGTEIDAENERLILSPDAEVKAGELTIEIAFDGHFNDQLVGPYLSSFDDDEGNEVHLVTTQFEATHARKCFPCWDEPDRKATFEIELVVEQGWQAVSNGPEVSRNTTEDGKTKIAFAPTIPMSTYLVAFVAGPLEFSEPVDVGGVPLRIVHIPGKSELTPFALEVGAFALRYFSEYFGLPYPGQKLDLVAIPDFAFGAMENLGCVTFRESLLLIDPSRATQPELQRAADVINHEIAHMWFGDLVTMKWWNGLWLNEAFATFMEMRCTDAFRPQWDRWTDFGLSRTAAFATDSLCSTRPIEYEVVSPTEAEGMFDVLTYEKGAAVVRMLEQHLGEDTFRKGIRLYMERHKYDNADTGDLWDALEAESDQPVREIMESWIYQGGYPQVVVGRNPSSPTKRTISQTRMTLEGADATDSQVWAVPVSYRSISGHQVEDRKTERVLLRAEPQTINVESEDVAAVVNADGSGFFRVAYEADDLEALASVAIDKLSPVERYALIDDSWAAVLSDQMSTPTFLTTLEGLSGESNRSVWVRIISGFGQLRHLVYGEARERLEEVAHDAMAPVLAGLGLAPQPQDTEQELQLRADLVRGLGVIANDPEIQEDAKQTSAAGLREPELVESSLLAATIDVVAASGDAADFDDFVAAWKRATTPQEELRYLSALTDFPDPDLVGRLHKMILDGEVRSQNAPFLLRRALTNESCGRTTWDFIAANWKQLNEAFASSLVVRMLDGVTSLTTPEDQTMVADFFETHSVPSGERTLQQILEKQRVRVALRQREAARLSQFLTS